MNYLNLGPIEDYSRKILQKLFVVHLLLLVLMLSVSSLDHWIENQMYLGNGIWLLEKSFHPIFFWLLYSLPKDLVIAIGAILLFKALQNLIKKNYPRAASYTLAILTLGLVPAGISFLKDILMVPCPYHLIEYGGTEVTRSVIFFLVHRAAEAGQCFPAGHASGGFALVGLLFLARTRREVLGIIILSETAGYVMGIYQQARGAHFFSHTLATQVLALGFVLAIYELVYRRSSALGVTLADDIISDEIGAAREG